MLMIEDLKESNAFLTALLDNLVSGIFIVDKDIRIRSFNDSFKALFQKQQEKILGELCGNALGCEYTVLEGKDCGDTIHCKGCKLRDSLLKSFTEKVPAYKEKLFRNFYIDGELVKKYFQYTAKYVTFNNEEMVLIIVDDISELMEANLKLKQISVTDGLTGLYNHKYIFHRLEEEVKKSQRYETPMSIIMLDIDHFKKINDTYGHQVGDTTLAAVSRAIKDTLREVDIPGRYGGEEFIAILPQTKLLEAFITAERIREMVETIVFEEKGLSVTISGGVAEFRKEPPLRLIERADRRLYQAKESGRNCIVKD